MAKVVTADLQVQHLLLSLPKTNAEMLDKVYMSAVPRWESEKNFKLSFLVTATRSTVLHSDITKPLKNVSSVAERRPRNSLVKREISPLRSYFEFSYRHRASPLHHLKHESRINITHRSLVDINTPPVPDIYGEKKRFIVKIQPLPMEVSKALMVYDVTNRVAIIHERTGYDKILALAIEKGSGDILLRIYLYAQRIDGHTLKVFHQNLPSQDFSW
ncbi:hypothetical protein FRB96_007316 [Tulasnella sp. 330]|nr:hypothetical protein FRB96_007316 [Tulasnella sp. 330]